MKKEQLLALILVFTCFWSSCLKDKCNEMITYTKYTPVYMSKQELRNSVQQGASRTIKNSGKIYLHNNYIFINELNEGFHVIDNSDPASPQNIGFVAIPGNVDISAKYSNIYADSYSDLVVLDISNPQSISETYRIEDVFLETYLYTNVGYLGVPDTSQGVVVEWIAEEVTEEIDCNDWRGNQRGDIWMEQNTVTTAGGGVANFADGGSRNAGISLAGSMSRFAINKNYLYAVGTYDMDLFDITNPSEPQFQTEISIGWNIETIFPYKDHLFIGSSNGMYIYDNSNPSDPTYMSMFSHVNSCDPVVVQDNVAYVTLRSGTECQGFSNQLDVIDISDLYNPDLIATYEMTNPHGLGIDDDVLFICDGADGLKVYNASDSYNIDENELAHVTGLTTYDVIPYNDILILRTDNSLIQYDYSDPQNIVEISKIN